MASHFGQKHPKTKKQEQQHKPKHKHPTSTHPASEELLFFLEGMLFSKGGSLSFATQDCTLLKMPSLLFPLFFWGGRDVALQQTVERQLHNGAEDS